MHISLSIIDNNWFPEPFWSSFALQIQSADSIEHLKNCFMYVPITYNSSVLPLLFRCEPRRTLEWTSQECHWKPANDKERRNIHYSELNTSRKVENFLINDSTRNKHCWSLHIWSNSHSNKIQTYSYIIQPNLIKVTTDSVCIQQFSISTKLRILVSFSWMCSYLIYTVFLWTSFKIYFELKHSAVTFHSGPVASIYTFLRCVSIEEKHSSKKYSNCTKTGKMFWHLHTLKCIGRAKSRTAYEVIGQFYG